AQRMPHEVRYYQQPDLPPAPSVYAGDGFVPLAYGSFFLRALDAHGGYIATSDDLIRFLLAMDGTRGPALLTPQAIDAMQSTPRPPLLHPSPAYPMDRGLAWDTVALADGGYTWSHPGALLGSNGAWMYRDLARGVALAVVFNTLPGALTYHTFFDQLMTAMKETIAAVDTWPHSDGFAS
ncbi:MAG: serine hydrolase, partial [Thermomicrobiales bacterium]